MEPADVRRRWPGAVEAIVGSHGRLTVGSEGTLWFEDDVPSEPQVWHPERGWIAQSQFRPDACGCGRALKERGRCSGCGSWPSKCLCPKEAA
jgi:hypothetical protein